MAPLTRALALCALLTNARGASPLSTWDLVLLKDAVQDGAMCLDGSPAAIYVKPGVGKNAQRWILFFEGGGWCESTRDCYERSFTALGSSRNYSASTHAWSARDVLMPNCTVNSFFCEYTTVYAPYCDGASRAGNLDAPVNYNGRPLYYRGFRVLKAVLAALLAPSTSAMPSLADASSLLISGSSAGGLTTFLHSDFIADTVHAVAPSCDVRALPEVGFFIDGASIWGGARLMTDVFSRIAVFANITGGAPEQVNAACVAGTPEALRWRCFMAQYTLPFIRTPLFILNSVVDQWQTENVLAPNLNITYGVSTYEPFKPCIIHPTSGCNATQALQWTNYSSQFLLALDAARAATPTVSIHGGFITSCPIHTTNINGLSHRIKIGGVSMYEAYTAWMSGKGQAWTIDVPYPRDITCPPPSLEGEDLELYP